MRAGTGDNPEASDVVFVHYTGKLADGTVFDQSQPISAAGAGHPARRHADAARDMVPGFREAALQMQSGGKYTVEIPADKAYGAEGRIARAGDPAQCRPDLRDRAGRLHADGRSRAPLPDAPADDAAAAGPARRRARAGAGTGRQPRRAAGRAAGRSNAPRLAASQPIAHILLMISRGRAGMIARSGEGSPGMSGRHER